MKLTTSVALVLVMMLVLTGMASAARPVDGTFQIRGYTTSYEYRKLPSGLTAYHILARSSNPSKADQAFCQATYGMRCEQTCKTFAPARCGVSGYFDGQFTFEEWGQVDYDPATGQGSGRGTNHGTVTITEPEGKVVVGYSGTVSLDGVVGKFALSRGGGTGADAGLSGQGNYTGVSGLLFTVTFTGRFKDGR